LYITDVGKNAAFKVNLKRYWRSKLEIEIKGIGAERVIFIGEQARSSGYQHVPTGTRAHCLDFPSWRHKTFKSRGPATPS
jgi:hypothetical protein